MVSVDSPQNPRNIAAALDEICEQFELKLRSGSPAKIEDFLPRTNDADQLAQVVIELVSIELELKQGLAVENRESLYLHRFPEFSIQLRELFRLSKPKVQHNDDAGQTLLTESPDLPGMEVLHEVGRGGMGIVWKARDLQLNRLVAIKQLFPGVHQHFSEIHNFKREALTISRLQHHGIVQVFGVIERDQQCFLVLEFIDGLNLGDMLAGKPHSLSWSIDIILRVASAVDHAHQAGIIHRDLKPANILLAFDSNRQTLTHPAQKAACHKSGSVDYADRVVVTDFGLAKRLNSHDTISQAGATFGTPSYMSPEQADCRSFEMTPASDVFALGAVLYEMLTGRPAFKGGTHLETLRQVCESEPVSIHQLRVDIPRQIEEICMTCLKKNPQERFASMEALVSAFRKVILSAKQRESRPVGSSGLLAKLVRPIRFLKSN